MQASMNLLEKKIEGKIDEHIEKITEAQKKSDVKLNWIEKNTTELSDRIVTLEKEVDSKSRRIDRLEKKIEEFEQTSRSHNVIIEGLQEENNENLRKKLDDLFEALELPYDSEWIDTAYRMGVKPDNPRRPRAVKVNFPFLRYRNQLFRNTYKLKRIQKYKKVYLVDDYSQEVQEQLKEIRAINAYAKSQNLDSKVKGTNLVIDEKTYSYKDTKNLPHELSIEAAKIIQVEDGVAFQSKHAFLSNRYPCKIRKDDKDFSSSEQIFHYTRAMENEQGGVAQLILQEHDPREIQKLGRRVKESQVWKTKEVPTMAAIQKLKFDQNPHLKDKLCRVKGHIYEATTHAVYGCGFTLAQGDQINKTSVDAGTAENKLGIELEKLRDSYTQDTK